MKGRLRCVLFGCGSDEVGCCPNCSLHPHMDAGYIDRGKLEWLLRFWWSAKTLRWITRRCEVCGKRMWFKHRLNFTCSEKCTREWIPF